jgi:hypothetical protein
MPAPATPMKKGCLKSFIDWIIMQNSESALRKENSARKSQKTEDYYR